MFCKNSTQKENIMKKLLGLVIISFVLFLTNYGNAMINSGEFVESKEKILDTEEISDKKTIDSPRSIEGEQLSIFLKKNLDLNNPETAFQLLNDEVLKIFKKFSNLSNDSIRYEVAETYQILGDCLLNKKNFSASAEAYIQSLKIVDNNHDLHCFLNRLCPGYTLSIDSLNLDKKDSAFNELKENISDSLSLYMIKKGNKLDKKK